MGLEKSTDWNSETSTGSSSTRSAGEKDCGAKCDKNEYGDLNVNQHVETCAICADEAQPCHAVRLLCGHGWYCLSCMQQFAEERLASGHHDVPCPECRSSLSPAVVRNVLPESIVQRLLNRSLESAVGASGGGLLACPTPDCPERVALEEGQIPRYRCRQCRREHCLKCQASPYHVGQTCEEYAATKLANSSAADAERLFQDWMKKTGTPQCPKCRFAITKDNLAQQRTQSAECHKMICRNCSTRFCFHCSAILTSTSTCGCTPDGHGFINPKTGRFVTHLRTRQ